MGGDLPGRICQRQRAGGRGQRKRDAHPQGTALHLSLIHIFYQWVDNQTAQPISLSDSFRKEEFFICHGLYDQRGTMVLSRDRYDTYKENLRRVLEQSGALSVLFAGLYSDGRYIGPVSYTHLDVYKRQVIDVTLPAQKNKVGHSHPNTIALEEVERIFVGMGYEVVEGPEVEYDR